MTLKVGSKNIASTTHLLTKASQQGWGLMFKKRLLDEAYIFVFSKPKWDMVHMFFMRIPIDIVWLDEKKKIVGTYESALPWQMPIPFPCKAKYMIEMPTGYIVLHKLKKGKKLSF